ncbi:alpha-L-fucosidase [Streptomyces sp. VRA16 Mangrove soil]|uniref:alpha-L-fucosidase n=1 Tax=Streptomyces sp. VRA16 Mangrove soil TaxID=2817434 RepID=UPI001A9F5F02|nr:alpha-L-fucosidase [Streptomyces sp. VRA16 Mangrove soil]MBO1330740.1 alpha-L-fucosidase [Streptomyces sp. VRA16 Mangrove soil]
MRHRDPHRPRRLAALATALSALLSALLLTPSPAPAAAAPTASATADDAVPGMYNPRQNWLRAASGGLFLHWGMYTEPKHYDCASWEKAVNDSGWNPDYWVDQTKKLHGSYIVLATFHSRLGYARPWPSKIPGSCSTRRDILGELIDAAKAKGIKVILYMTDDPQWHDYAGPESLDSGAYSAYKGKNVDLTTRPGFGEFSYDNFFEVMKRYKDLAGFWIDNDNEYWEDHHLYEQIREQRPDMLLSNNNEDTPIMDTVSNEQKTGMTPDYDMPAAYMTSMPRLTESCYKVPSTGAWWYDGQDRPVDTALNIRRYIANAGTSYKSLMDFQAQVDGTFPPQQQAFIDTFDRYIDPIWKSVNGVEGGGYLYGGLRPGAFDDGAYGYTTVSKSDPTRQYIHVTTRPTGTDQVRLRDNGHKVEGITDLRTGRRIAFDQRDGSVTLKGIKDWDPYDTVFQVTTLRHKQGLYAPGSVTATATSAKDGHPAANLTDGDATKLWDADGKVPVSITLDLGDVKKAQYVGIDQTEWSPTYNRESFGRKEDSARIKDYKVYVSDDGEHWGEPVKTGVMDGARSTRYIDLDTTTRYIKLEVDSIWAAPTVTKYYNQLKIDEITVGRTYPRGHSPE